MMRSCLKEGQSNTEETKHNIDICSYLAKRKQRKKGRGKESHKDMLSNDDRDRDKAIVLLKVRRSVIINKIADIIIIRIHS